MSTKDFGNIELDNIYNSLSTDDKKEFDAYKPESQLEILGYMNNPEIIALYDKTPVEQKDTLNKMSLYEKYWSLNSLLETKQMKKEKKRQDRNKLKNNLDTFVNNDGPVVNNDGPVVNNDGPVVNNDGPVGYDNADGNDHDEDDENIDKVNKNTNDQRQQQFHKLVSLYYDSRPYFSYGKTNSELEVKFGTKGIKYLNKTDYDNVIRKLLSLKYNTLNSKGKYMLRINNEFTTNEGKKRMSTDIRTEIKGINNIQEYCRTNSVDSIETKTPDMVNVERKSSIIDKKKILPVNFNDFNFRVSYSEESRVHYNFKKDIISKWKDNKKTFRFINRVTFTHPDYPVNVDISIVKSSSRSEDKRYLIPVYNIEDSNVFNNDESYEVEIEVDNNRVGPTTQFNTSEKIVASLKKTIKHVLSGLQDTNYPISYVEQKTVYNDYIKMILGKDYDKDKWYSSKYFIGPNSITLQTKNLIKSDEMNNVNVLSDFVVTDKADGMRHLLFINSSGHVYLMNTNMDIKFTGSITKNKLLFNSLLDGELITHDKHNKFINLYAAFDLYYLKENDIRHYTFMSSKDSKDKNKSRYYHLIQLVKNLKLESIVNTSQNNQKQSLSPITIVSKQFYPKSSQETIFDGCREILQKSQNGLFPYTTDGLIFTHALFGVGSSEVNKAGPKQKVRWDYSFKWKPPEYNTIDFLVTTVKNSAGDDLVKTIYDEGIDTNKIAQLNEYKVLELRCGFNEKNDGYMNPCQNIIDDDLPNIKSKNDNKYDDYKPVKFLPTNPYDPTAGMCNIMIKVDDSGSKQIFSEENDVFGDKTIVEFSYNHEAEHMWKWVPLRVRHDKTAEYRRGAKPYNSYETANNNWTSIHNPITEEMITTGRNIPSIELSEDIYYNNSIHKTSYYTDSMKNFHNLYVKSKLISCVANPGDLLIDFACGKAGDLNRWIHSKLGFVLGIDFSTDNLENRLNSACSRYLNAHKEHKKLPGALFVHGNSTMNIKNTKGILNEKGKQIVKSIFNIGPNKSATLGKGVEKHHGIASNGFHVSSCQFAFHYFLESPATLKGFMTNLAECTKLNGYFIGTTYDGAKVFNMLKPLQKEDSTKILHNDKLIWEIEKHYNSTTFNDDSSSIGLEIKVFQESINNPISEYLVNFNYIVRIMELYGFQLIDKEEASEFGLPNGSGLFIELFNHMMKEMNNTKSKDRYGKAPNMNDHEKKISFLNRYFIFKKIREVNTDKIIIDTQDYQDEKEASEQREEDKERSSIPLNKKRTQNNKTHKLKKLNKTIILEPVLELDKDNNKEIEKMNVEVDDENGDKQQKTNVEQITLPVKKPTKKTLKNKTKKKKLIIE